MEHAVAVDTVDRDLAIFRSRPNLHCAGFLVAVFLLEEVVIRIACRGDFDGQIGHQALPTLTVVQQRSLLRTNGAHVRAMGLAQEVVLLPGDCVTGGSAPQPGQQQTHCSLRAAG
jgi:hypothetical protein